MTRIIWVPDKNAILVPVLGSLGSSVVGIVCLLPLVSYLVPSESQLWAQAQPGLVPDLDFYSGFLSSAPT